MEARIKNGHSLVFPLRPPMFRDLNTSFFELSQTSAKEFGKRTDACLETCLRAFFIFLQFPMFHAENLIVLEDAECLDSELSQRRCSFALLHLTPDVPWLEMPRS